MLCLFFNFQAWIYLFIYLFWSWSSLCVDFIIILFIFSLIKCVHKDFNNKLGGDKTSPEIEAIEIDSP